MAERSADYSMRAVIRVCDLLDHLRAQPSPVGLRELAEAASLPKPTVFRYLQALEARGYVTRSADGSSYQVGSALLALRPRALEHLAELSLPYLENLRALFDETVNLGVLEGTQVVYVQILESSRSTRFAARLGDRDPLYCTALGKAMAATMPRDWVEAALATQKMAPRTHATITDTGRYLAELEQVRSLGYAVDNEENEPDGRCIAMALEVPWVRAAISVSAPAHRFPNSKLPTAAEHLTRTVTALNETLKEA